MDLKKVNKDLEAIILKKNELNALTYDHKDYDDVEEELHDLEDDFLDAYGDELEEVLDQVHVKIDADNDVLLPIAYVGAYYKPLAKNADGSQQFEIAADQGVLVESGKFKNTDTRLIFLPSPLRLILTTGKDKKVVVWGEGQ
ncbi:MAG TPA: hypothetical protein VK796_04700 [Cytophaga sp.]|jgi:hypothetical protein|nr:hypothetical protein [Cytophaga sp.]